MDGYHDCPSWVYGTWTDEFTTPEGELSKDWIEKFAGLPPLCDATWKRFLSRREAEDAAALAFGQLPAARRAELLAGPTKQPAPKTKKKPPKPGAKKRKK
jgi:hypothetical protein